MPHAIRAAIVLGLALIPRPAPSAQATDSGPDRSANAALKYWQAFALLPAVDKDDEKRLEQWNKVPLDPGLLKLIEKSQGSREYLHRAARLRRCDWGLDYEDGVFMRLPYLPKARSLAVLTALHARHAFEQGHWRAGWDDVTALLALGRHLEMEPLFIQRWVGRAVESVAIDAAAPYLPEMKAVLAADAPAVIDALPSGATLEQVVRREKEVFLMSAIRQLKETERRRPGSWKEFWKNGFDHPESRGAAQSVQTFDQAVKWLEDFLPLYDELARLAALPSKEFEARYPEFIAKAKAVNPLADQVLPMNRVMVATEQRTLARLALFRAALAVIQGGSDRLRDVPDPYGDGPFEYRTLDGGFELRSKLRYQDKPVALTVGRPAKG
jgi:hypothetical protein